MRIGMRGPNRYLQEAGILKEAGTFGQNLGSRFLIVSSPRTERELGPALIQSLEEAGCQVRFLTTTAGTTLSEIDRIAAEAHRTSAEALLGIGGGSIMDNTRAAADITNLPLMLMPTAASSDAPCSTAVIVHSESGAVTEVRSVRRNPDLVLVDTEVIAKAPKKLLIAGIGDAIATYYEAKAAYSTGSITRSGGASSRTALANAALCRDILFEYTKEALAALERGTVNDAFEQLIHAVFYLSGLGSENGGTAAAHAVNDGFTALKQAGSILHGNLVAFGLLVQLELENPDTPAADPVRKFLSETGLPITLEQLGLTQVSENDLWTAAGISCTVAPMKRMPFPVCPKDVYQAICRADKKGRVLLQKEKQDPQQ